MTFYDRLLKERAELETRIKALQSFADTVNFHTIDQRQQALLRIQLTAMNTYQECLNQRIAILPEPEQQSHSVTAE